MFLHRSDLGGISLAFGCKRSSWIKPSAAENSSEHRGGRLFIAESFPAKRVCSVCGVPEGQAFGSITAAGRMQIFAKRWALTRERWRTCATEMVLGRNARGTSGRFSAAGSSCRRSRVSLVPEEGLSALGCGGDTRTCCGRTRFRDTVTVLTKKERGARLCIALSRSPRFSVAHTRVTGPATAAPKPGSGNPQPS